MTKPKPQPDGYHTVLQTSDFLTQFMILRGFERAVVCIAQVERCGHDVEAFGGDAVAVAVRDFLDQAMAAEHAKTMGYMVATPAFIVCVTWLAREQVCLHIAVGKAIDQVFASHDRAEQRSVIGSYRA